MALAQAQARSLVHRVQAAAAPSVRVAAVEEVESVEATVGDSPEATARLHYERGSPHKVRL